MKKEKTEIVSYNHDVPELIELDDALLEKISGGKCRTDCPNLETCGTYTLCGVDVAL